MGLFSLNTAKILAKAKKCLEKKDYDFALIELKRIEKEYHAPEHPEVLFLMGKIYYLKDENQKAFEYVKRASYVEYPDAMNYLAAFYMSGIGTEINYGESLKWARRAISKGIEDSKQALQNGTNR